MSKPMMSGRERPVRLWRVGLLLTLAATILFASISYDDWILVGAYLRGGLWEEIARRSADARQERLDRRRRHEDLREARVEGSIDGVFKDSVRLIEIQPDGGILVGGAHTRAGLGLARLRLDGSLDRAFADHVLAAGVGGSVEEISSDDTGFTARGFLQEQRHPFRSLHAVRFWSSGEVDRESLDHALRAATQAATHYVSLMRNRGEWPYHVAGQLPSDARIEHVLSGPGRSALVYYGEKVPEEQEDGGWVTVYDGPGRQSRRIFIVPTLCGNDALLRTRYRPQVALFDGDGHLSTQADTVAPSEVVAAHLRTDGAWIVRGRLKDGSGDEAILWRVVSRGTDPSFRPLLQSDLEPELLPNAAGQRSPLVLASAVQADGRIIVGGNFTSIRGRPRLHIARLNSDGSLDE